MQLPPIEVIATWPTANYVNPSEVRGPTILILTLIFIPLLVILIALRVYTRLRLSRNFGADDVAIIAALFPTMGCAILSLIAVLHYGWSRHVWDVPADQLVTGLKLVIAVEILFVTGASLTKVSMLLLINRIMASGSIALKRISMILMVIVCVDCIIYLIVAVNTCSPVSAYWTLSFAPQNCINEAVHLLAGGVINTLTDFCVVLLPIPVVLKLKLPLRQRIACVMLFGAGFIVCIAAGVRMSYTWQLNTTYDKTWLAYPVWIAATIELYLGIIATSIPAIKPLIGRYFPKILGSNYSTYAQPSLNSYVRSAEPRIEMGTSITLSSGPNDFDPDQKYTGRPGLTTTITSVSVGKSKPLPLPPPISAFSTHEQKPSIIAPNADSNQPRALWKEAESSKTSLNSFELGWQPRGEGGLGAPRRFKRVESREKLVGEQS